MMKVTSIRMVSWLMFLLSPALLWAQSNSVTVVAAKDNTLYFSANGTLSNGAGSYLFAGSDQSGASKRALIQFDLSSIPANAVIDSVRLRLNMSKTTAGATTITLHRLTSDWGEGTSDAGGEEGGGAAAASNDATWIHAFFNSVSWASAGGDYASSSSASRTISGTGAYTWGSTSTMVADVQGWVNDASQNFGWILIGDEEVQRSTKRFDSKENSTAANRPTLTVHYSQTTSVAEESELPNNFRLEQNYPNPFNPTTTIKYALEKPAKVTLTVFDLLGNTVAVLVDEEKSSGEHEVVFEARSLQSGVYFYQIEAAGATQTRKLTLVK